MEGVRFAHGNARAAKNKQRYKNDAFRRILNRFLHSAQHDTSTRQLLSVSSELHN